MPAHKVVTVTRSRKAACRCLLSLAVGHTSVYKHLHSPHAATSLVYCPSALCCHSAMTKEIKQYAAVPGYMQTINHRSTVTIMIN